MKKLIALLMSLVMLLSLAACGEGEMAGRDEDTQTVAQNDGASDTQKPVSPSEEQAKPEGPVFWFNTQDWGRIPEGSFDGTLFASRMPIPVELDELDSYAAPYHWFPDQSGKVEIDSITEITTSTMEVEGWREGHQVQAYSKADGFGDIYVLNYLEDRDYDDRMMTLAECCDNDWWYMVLYVEDLFWEIQPTGNWDQVEYAEAILDVFGEPSCIMISYEDTMDQLEANRGNAGYHLVYEIDDCVLEFIVQEEIDEYEPGAFETSLAVTNCRYYTQTCWEHVSEGYIRVEV